MSSLTSPAPSTLAPQEDDLLTPAGKRAKKDVGTANNDGSSVNDRTGDSDLVPYHFQALLSSLRQRSLQKPVAPDDHEPTQQQLDLADTELQQLQTMKTRMHQVMDELINTTTSKRGQLVLSLSPLLSLN